MAGPNDMASWMQSLMQNQGAGSVNLGPSILAWLQSMGQGQGGGPNTGPGQGNVGPVNGFLPDPTQTPPNPRGDGPADVMSPAAMYAAQGGYGGPQAAADAAHAPPPRPPNWLTSTGAGMSPSSPPPNWLTSTGAGMSTPPGSPSATPRPADAAPTGPLASPDATAPPMKRRAGAPDLGYYQPNDRFVSIDRPNAPAEGGGQARGGPPQMTALNLAGLFNRGPQPAVNPNVPAAAAQPVSAAAPSQQSQAPWNYGPIQPGNIWRGSGGPRPRGGGY